MIRVLLFLICATAALAEKRAIRPPAGPTAGPYSAGIVAGNFLYISGHVGPEPGGGFAPGDVKTQTRRCLELVGKVLKEAGLDYRNVVSTTLYLADIRTLGAADAAYREFFEGPVYPARVEIESQLLIPEALSEVSAIAVLGDWRASIALTPDGWNTPRGPVSHAVLAAGQLFASSLRPVDPASGAVAGKTPQAQIERIRANARAVLNAARFSAPVREKWFVADGATGPGLTPRAVAAPLEPDHLAQLQLTAGPGVVQVSGRGAGAGGIREQTREALESLRRQLRQQGLSFANAVEAVVWLREPRHAAAMNEVYREIVTPNPPARATVRLSPAASPGAAIEIVMTAVK